MFSSVKKFLRCWWRFGWNYARTGDPLDLLGEAKRRKPVDEQCRLDYYRFLPLKVKRKPKKGKPKLKRPSAMTPRRRLSKRTHEREIWDRAHADWLGEYDRDGSWVPLPPTRKKRR